MKNWLVPLGVIGAILLLGLTIWGSVNSIRNEAIGKETTLTADYRSNQNELSTYVSSFYEQVGIADRKSAQMDAIITDAVQGRYGDPASGGGFKGNGQLFSAITEAYPNVAGTDIYDKIMDTIASGRAAFKEKQNKLLDEVRDYDTWRAQGIFRSWALGNFFPSSHLRADVNGKTFYGPEAEEHMRNIVITSAAAKAFDSGEMTPLALPPLPGKEKPSK